MIVIITKERENNAKHQQIISGVGYFAYWMSNFIVDFIKWMIPSSYFYVMFYLLNYEFYTEESNGKMMLILFLLYGFNNILFVYVSSYFFKSIGKAQVFTFVFHYFWMCFMPLLSFVLRFFQDTQKIEHNYLEFIWRIIPSYSFSFAIFNLPYLRIYAAIFAWPDVPDAFDYNGCRWEMLYLIATGIILFFALIFIEF